MKKKTTLTVEEQISMHPRLFQVWLERFLDGEVELEEPEYIEAASNDSATYAGCWRVPDD